MMAARDKVRSRASSGGVATAASTGELPPVLRMLTDTRTQDEVAKALPPGLEVERFLRVARTAVQANPALLGCTPRSIIAAIHKAASYGLDVGPVGQAYLVPYKETAQLIIGYRGMITLARRSGELASIEAREVKENDEFEFEYGLHPRLRHVPALTDRGKLVCFYGIAQFINGGSYMIVVDLDTIEEHRRQSPTGNRADGPWMTNYEAMGRKGLAVDTPIPTPDGWSTMGRLSVGDRVFDMDGRQCRVLATSEVKNIGCYRVTFANGMSIVCDEEHYWLARIGNGGRRRPWRAYGIGELCDAKERGARVTMPVVGSLDVAHADLPIDPWVLGYWLGNGRASSPNVTTNGDDAEEVCAAITAAGYSLGAVRRDPRANAVSIQIKGVTKRFAALGLIGAKHVPPMYLRASADQRSALLRGLVDSDGHVDLERGRAHFYSTDPALAGAVAELARSLGEMVHVDTRQMTGYGKTVVAHSVTWQPTSAPASVARKAERFRHRQIAPYRGVATIERVPSVPTRCIEVDSPTRTYAAGVDMIPTHNTVIRIMEPYLPLTTEAAEAIATDDAIPADTATVIDTTGEAHRPEPEPEPDPDPDFEPEPEPSYDDEP